MNRIKLKYLTESTFLYGANESAVSENINEPRYIRITDIKSNGELKPETFKSLSYEKAKPYLLLSGDILFARTGATVGKAYIHEQDSLACFAGYLIRFRANKNKLLPKLLFYYTRTLEYQNWIESNTIQATIQNVSAEKYKELKIPIFSITEQKLIVSYLDSKTSEINSLISLKEKQIQLLEEQCQALITEAVTKGLSPDVKMKDSGVEWLGEIPKNWGLKKIKYVVGNKSNKKLVKKEDNYIGLENIKSNYGGYVKVEDQFIEGLGILAQEKDILLGKLRPYLNKTLIVKKESKVSSEILVLEPKNYVYFKYLYFLFFSKLLMETINSSTYGAKMPRASWENVGDIYIPIPTIEEQEQIVIQVESKQEVYNNIISMTEKQIIKLKEYRQSLIHEAVTGKISINEIEKHLKEVEDNGN